MNAFAISFTSAQETTQKTSILFAGMRKPHCISHPLPAMGTHVTRTPASPYVRDGSLHRRLPSLAFDPPALSV